MHVWNLWGPVPPIRLRTTALYVYTKEAITIISDTIIE